MKIDAHHHFWAYSPTEYPWMKDPLGPLRKDYLPEDLHREIHAAGIDGVVSVQVRQELKENAFFLDFADEHDWILGVVGWLPLCDPAVQGAIDQYKDRKGFVGCRHIIQDEPDDDFILRPDFNAGITALTPSGLVYDILIYERQLKQSIAFVDQHPNQVFVLDHIAKPRIGDQLLEPWKTYMSQLAERENVYCKLSGMATEAVWDGWTEEQLLPYLDHTLSCFGPKRLMFGSDWPVAVLAVAYGRWVKIVHDYIATLSADEQDRIWSGTAIEAYKLEIPAGR
jgi:L-fuconolactonase